MKGTIKIAYWDTEQAGARPPLLGEIKGTPTIRLYKPKKKQGNSDRKKVVVDYNYERKAKDMKKFVDAQMPNFIERVNGLKDMSAFEEKAKRHGLPMALLFTSKPNTSPLTKYLSTEFRRRLLLTEIKPTKPNKEIIEQYGVTDFPALIVILPNDEEKIGPILYDGDGFSRHRLHSFLSKHALKDKVFSKKKEAPKQEQNDGENKKGGTQEDKINAKKKEKVEL